MATSSGGSFLRQLSSKEGWKSASRRWGGSHQKGSSLSSMMMMYGGDTTTTNTMFVLKKRVMVVVDQSSHSKHAMMWALSHVTNKGDILTLLHIHPPSNPSPTSSIATTLGSLCKACKPEVEVEALVIQGPRLATIISQVKKLEVSVLVLGQKNPSPFLNCLCLKSSTEELVEECISKLECLTIGVKKQSNGIGGYLISTRWHKNFWLLA